MELYFPFNKHSETSQKSTYRIFVTHCEEFWEWDVEILTESTLFFWWIYEETSASSIKFMRDDQFQVAFKEICKLAELIMTIPSSISTVARSFSAMKRIHTCCRGTQTQERLCGLSVLAIEKTYLVELKKRPSFYDNALTQLLKQNRRLELVYK
jgi:hypothetical protein